MTVSDLLAASRKAHEDYRRNVPHMRPDTSGKLVPTTGNAGAANASMREALRLRLLADSQDPAHTDQAWQDELATRHQHNDLVNWYQTMLGSADGAA
jgi:hypothetical protein